MSEETTRGRLTVIGLGPGSTSRRIAKARSSCHGRAFAILREVPPGAVPVVFGRAAGRADEKMTVTDLASAEGALADMATCVIVGSRETRTVARNGLPPLVYSPRTAGRPV